MIDGEEFLADMIVKARFTGNEAFFLIHIEHQSTAPVSFASRYFRYHLAIFSKLGLPVYPIVLADRNSRVQ